MHYHYDVDFVKRYGVQWTAFDQAGLREPERQELFRGYFRLFPFEVFGPNAVGLDVGCGTGRWAQCVAPLVGKLHCLDISGESVQVARRNLSRFSNCVFHVASADAIPVEDGSMDFAYCIGVLHAIPDPRAALSSCAAKLKRGAPLLLYVFYSLENRPAWFRALWKVVHHTRRVVCRLPLALRRLFSLAVALLAYFPLARGSLLLEKLGCRVDNIPLSAYRTRSFYTMRTDAFERFDQPWEHRFSRRELEEMMRNAGLTDIRISDEPPYWSAIGYRA